MTDGGWTSYLHNSNTFLQEFFKENINLQLFKVFIKIPTNIQMVWNKSLNNNNLGFGEKLTELDWTTST